MITLAEYIQELENLTEKLESEGMTTSDAQGCADAELFRKYGVHELDLMQKEAN